MLRPADEEKGSEEINQAYSRIGFCPSIRGSRANFSADSGFLKFLGTARARFVVAKQLRASGGVFLSAHGESLIIDPGLGTLVQCASSRPAIDASTLSGVSLTHGSNRRPED